MYKSAHQCISEFWKIKTRVFEKIILMKHYTYERIDWNETLIYRILENETLDTFVRFA